MIKCQNCGTDNLDNSEYCDECGSRLNIVARVHNSGSGFIPPQLPPPTFTRDTVTPKPATPYTPPPPPPPAVSQTNMSASPPPPASVPSPVPAQMQTPQMQTPQMQTPTLQPPVAAPPQHSSQPPAQQAAKPQGGGGKTMALRSPDGLIQPEVAGDVGIRAKLAIQRGGRIGREFPITSEDSLIGRWDADGGIFPDVDLDQDDPEAKVSRRHARITIQGNQFYVEDLGSTNGTFVNRGQRLLPGNRHPLNHGDEIIVGKTFLKFILN